MIKLLIFDFDGTIVDTKNLYYSSIHRWLKGEKIVFSEKEFVETFGMKLSDILKLMKVKNNIQEIRDGVHNDVFSSVNKIKVSKDARYVPGLKIKKILLSNTISKHIKMVVKAKKINYFREVYGGDNFPNKVYFIKKYMKRNKLKKNEVIYIGDMVKDIEVAREAGCIGVSISHEISWNTRKELLEGKPEYIIDNLKDLAEIVKNIQ